MSFELLNRPGKGIFHRIEPQLPLQISRRWNCNRSQLCERTKLIRTTTTLAICANSAADSLFPPPPNVTSAYRHTKTLNITCFYFRSNVIKLSFFFSNLFLKKKKHSSTALILINVNKQFRTGVSVTSVI